MGFRKSAFACLFMFTVTGLAAQPFGQFGNAHMFDSEFLSDQYQKVYSLSPSALTLWDYGSWSNIGASYDYASGEFRNPQKFSRQSKFNFQTESVHALEDSGWKFYGLFRYANGQADSIRGNLSYRLPTNGSPYFMFMQRTGMWKEQKYEFNVIAANQITDRFSLGIRILYDGDLNFRYNDTRNNQTTLFTDLALTASYRIGQHVISAGAGYYRRKTEYSLTNKYPFDSQGIMYNVYHNTGLGSYIRNINARLTFMGETFNPIAQWLYHGNKHRLSLAYEGNIGSEYVINKSITAVARENRIMQYGFARHNINAAATSSFADSYLVSFLHIGLLSGEGEQYNENSESYLGNYTADFSKVFFSSNWYRPNSLLRKLGLEVSLDSENKFDRSFGYRFSYSNLSGGMNLQLARTFGNSRLALGAGGHYHMNLDHTLNPNAATNNIYTAWVAEPLMAYFSSDYIRIPAHIEFQMPLLTNLLVFRLEAEQLLPLQVNYPVSHYFTTNDQFFYLNSSIKLFF